MWLDFLGISMDPKRANGFNFKLNLVTPDNGEKYLVELSNATLTNIEGVQAANPDLTITLNRSDLNRVMMGVNTFDDLIKEGKATFVGNRKPFDQLLGLLVPFSPTFEVLPGTAPLPAGKTSKSAYVPGMAPPELAE
jgi:alkyl sulfatase BDS1-like metallo-beta-lactamase superfamily hydrolase